jgi:hypothetical protein
LIRLCDRPTLPSVWFTWRSDCVDADGRLRIRSRYWPIISAFIGAVFVFPAPWLAPGIVLFVVRAWFVTLCEIDDATLLVRNLLRTRRIAWSDVTKIDVRPPMFPSRQYSAYVAIHHGRRRPFKAAATLTGDIEVAERICVALRKRCRARGIGCRLEANELCAIYWT